MLEDMTDNEEGRLVTPGDPDDLANTLAELIKDPNERKRLGDNARVIFKNRFHPKYLVRTLKDLYNPLND